MSMWDDGLSLIMWFDLGVFGKSKWERALGSFAPDTAGFG